MNSVYVIALGNVGHYACQIFSYRRDTRIKLLLFIIGQKPLRTAFGNMAWQGSIVGYIVYCPVRFIQACSSILRL